jgi:hypothetical protein
MKTSETFHRDDHAAAHRIDCGPQGVIVLCQHPALCVPKLKVRAIHRTGIGLAMKAPVQGGVVLGSAALAHDKMVHRSVGAIIRQRLDDAEAGAAIGAVDKGIAMTPIVRLEDLAQTTPAGRDIRKDESGLLTSRFAIPYDKRRVADGRKPRGFEAVDMRVRRQLSGQADQKLLEVLLTPLRLDEHTLCCIPDPTLESQCLRQTVSKRTKADPLHGSVNREAQPLQCCIIPEGLSLDRTRHPLALHFHPIQQNVLGTRITQVCADFDAELSAFDGRPRETCTKRLRR